MQKKVVKKKILVQLPDNCFDNSTWMNVVNRLPEEEPSTDGICLIRSICIKSESHCPCAEIIAQKFDCIYKMCNGILIPIPIAKLLGIERRE